MSINKPWMSINKLRLPEQGAPLTAPVIVNKWTELLCPFPLALYPQEPVLINLPLRPQTLPITLSV